MGSGASRGNARAASYSPAPPIQIGSKVCEEKESRVWTETPPPPAEVCAAPDAKTTQAADLRSAKDVNIDDTTPLTGVEPSESEVCGQSSLANPRAPVAQEAVVPLAETETERATAQEGKQGDEEVMKYPVEGEEKEEKEEEPGAPDGLFQSRSEEEEEHLDWLQRHFHYQDMAAPPSDGEEEEGEEGNYDYAHLLRGDREDEDEDELDSEAERNADLFAYSAMSLGIENDELLFNMLYFGTGGGTGGVGVGGRGDQDRAQDCGCDSDEESDGAPAISSMALRTMLNSTVEETIAAHSANNTPYKLRPACNEDLERLKITPFGCADGSCGRGHQHSDGQRQEPDDCDCLVCSEEMERGCESIALPACGHVFHAPCILKWLKMQSWCPVCRTSVADTTDRAATGGKDTLGPVEEGCRKESILMHMRCGSSSPGPGGAVGGSPGSTAVGPLPQPTKDEYVAEQYESVSATDGR